MKINSTDTKKHSAKKAGKAAKRILPIVLSTGLLVGVASPMTALETPSEKEEVIYINLAADGSVKDIYAVNIFGKGDITDYGDYSSVEMLNTTDKISKNGDRISFSTASDRVYYKGKMTTAVMPWNISVRYYLDGTEYSAAEIAGKSGKLEIKFKITKNTDYTGNFFDSYALQATLSLDTKLCEHITADGATLANVGSKKQISYTVLPGEGLDATVSAEVRDFEMDAISVNGIPLSMNIEVDDSELLDKVNELLDAIAELDDGASDLKDGAKDLKDATNDDLKTGVGKLSDGVTKLKNGAADLKNGGAAMRDGTEKLKIGASDLYDGAETLNCGIKLIEQGLADLDEKSAELKEGSEDMTNALLLIREKLSEVSFSVEKVETLVSGSSEIKEAVDKLSEGVAELRKNVGFAEYKALMQKNGLDIDGLQKMNTQTAATLTAQTEEMKKQIEYLKLTGGDEAQITQLEASCERLQNIVKLLQMNNASIQGTETYLNGINKSIGELADGIAELKKNYKDLDDGINELATQIKSLVLDMADMKDGIEELIAEYGKLDGGINDYTDGVAEIVAGYSEIVDGSTDLLSGSGKLKSGTAELYGNTVDLLNGMADLYSGTDELKDAAGKLSDGVEGLSNGISELYNGTEDLKDGTGELKSETDGLDSEISDKIDGMIASITGSDTETVSFVSEKNTNTDSVQFIIQTEKIETEEVEPPAVSETETLTLWQKILRLFGLY